MKLRLLFSVISLSLFLSACDLSLQEIEESVRQNPEILDRIDEFTDSVREEIQSAIESGVSIEEPEEIVVEEVIIPSAPVSSSNENDDTIMTSSNDDPEEDADIDEVIEEPVVETSGVVEESSGVTEEPSTPPDSSGGGGGSSIVDPPSEETNETNESISEVITTITNLFIRYETVLSTTHSYNFFPGQKIEGIVHLNQTTSEFTKLSVRLNFSSNPDLWMTSETPIGNVDKIRVSAVIPLDYVVDRYERAEIIWETATTSGVFSPQWAASNGSIFELPKQTSLSLEPYTVLLRPEEFSGLVEEPLFAYAYEIQSGIYKVATVNVIRQETVLEDNGRKWGLVMVGQGHPENGIWIETSYSSAYRGQYAGVGHYYSLALDKFVSSLNQLNPNYVAPSTPTYNESSGLIDSGITSSGIIESGLVKSPPIISLNCNDDCQNDLSIRHNVFEDYIEPGATATSWDNQNLVVEISGFIDVSKLGTYFVSYIAVDEDEQVRIVQRKVIVVDATPPVITMNGEHEISIEINSTYTEFGATAKDNFDSSVIVTFEGRVDTSKIGDYFINYSAVDSSGNRSSVQRKVSVVDTQDPIVTVNTIAAFSQEYPKFDLNRDVVPFYNASAFSMDIHGDYYVVGHNTHPHPQGARTGAVALLNLYDRNFVRLIQPPTNVEMRFGNRVQINQEYIVVGAQMDNRMGFRSGSIYVYKINDPNYLRIITPTDGRTELRWGTSLVINDEYIIVGSRSDNTYFTQAGAVYVYRFDDYTYQHKFYAPNPTASASFGGSVDINENNILAIGAHHEEREFELEGAVYLYDLNTQQHIRTITPSVSRRILRFGQRLKIDSTHVLVGTDSSRHVHLYSIDDPSYERIFIEEVQQVHGNRHSSSEFGSAIKLHGDYIIVAARSHIHQRFPTLNPSQQGTVYIYSKTDYDFRRELIAPEFHIGFGELMSIYEDNLIIRARERLNTNYTEYYLYVVPLVNGTSIQITDDSSYEIEYFKNSVHTPLASTLLITSEGEHRLVVTDSSGNTTEIEFTK